MTVAPLRTLTRPETLSAAVVRHIGDAIMHGDFAPGQALPEFPLAEQLGVSRSTVREATRLLADHGLVELFPHRGAFVTRLTARNAREIYTLRAELESYAVAIALKEQRYSTRDWSDLELALAALETPGDSNLFVIAANDMHFHELLTRRCEHRLLLDALIGLRLQMLRFIVYTKLMDSDLESEGITHRRLLEAVRKGDAALGRLAVHRHIKEAGEQLLRILQADEASAPPPAERFAGKETSKQTIGGGG